MRPGDFDATFHGSRTSFRDQVKVSLARSELLYKVIGSLTRSPPAEHHVVAPLPRPQMPTRLFELIAFRALAKVARSVSGQAPFGDGAFMNLLAAHFDVLAILRRA